MATGDLVDELAKAKARRAAANSYASGLTTQQVSNVAAIATAYPHIGALAVPLGTAGLSPDHPAVVKAANAKAQQDGQQGDAGAKKSGGWLSHLWHGAANSTKAIVRYGLAGANAPMELIKFGVAGTAADLGIGEGDGSKNDSWGDAFKATTIGAGIAEAHDRGQLGAALGSAFTGSGADAEVSGGGWMIGSDTPAGMRQAAQLSATNHIDGHAFTLGRGIASATPLEPGSVGYHALSGLVDFGTYFLDPTAQGGKVIGKASRARDVLDKGDLVKVALPTRTAVAAGTTPTMVAGPAGVTRQFVAQNAGMVDGIRQTVLPERAAAWLNSGKKGEGNDVAQAIANIKPGDPQAFNKIWRGTGKKLPVDLVVKLVDATDPAAVKGHLAQAIGDGLVRDVVKVKVKQGIPRLAADARIAQMMPTARFNTDDVGDFVEQLDRFQRNARMPEDAISTNNLKLARATSKSEMYDVAASVMGTVKEGLKAHGFDEQTANRMTRMVSDARESNRVYQASLIGDGVVQHGIRVGDSDLVLGGPHLSTELLDGSLPIPDARDIKNGLRTSDMLRHVQASAPYDVGRTVLDFQTQSVFKPFALATRIAYPIRVVGEEQARMGAANYASMFHHPISYFALMIGDHPTTNIKYVDTATKQVKTGTQPSKMHQWFKDFALALSDNEKLAEGTAKAADVPNIGHAKLAAAKQAGNLGGDVLGKRFEDPDLVNGLTEWQHALPGGSGGWTDRTIAAQVRHWDTFAKHEPEYVEGWHNELIKLASTPEMREVARHGATPTKDVFWSGNLKHLREQMAVPMKEQGLDLTSRADSDRFIDTVAARLQTSTGGDPDLVKAVASGRLRGEPLTTGPLPNAAITPTLESMKDLGPSLVTGKLRVGVDSNPAADMLRHYENGVSYLMTHLMTLPTNRLSRSKVFKQAYWQRLEETLPLMQGSERARALRGAKEAGVPRAQLDRMKATAKAQTLDGRLTLEDADHLAKGFGLDTTRDLLYSLHEKAQVADALRVVFPFGEAFREVVTRWAKLGNPVRNPNAIYRASQIAREGQRSGFFYPDPQTGKEMFAIPGSEWVTDKLVGVPWKFQAPVSGLNMFGNVIPGVGPAVTLPASKLMPDKPEWDWVHSQLMPYGEADTGSGIVESFLPAWMRKMQVAFGAHPSARQQRQLASTTKDVMAYLASTGDYDLSTAEGQQKLLDESKDKARRLYILRAMAQNAAPSTPSPVAAARDKDGRLHTMFAMQADYRRMQQDPKIGYEGATEAFLNKYGDLAFTVTIPKSVSTGASATTDVVHDFARNHPDQAKRYPNTFGLFTPGGEVDPAEIERQIVAGTRTATTPEQALGMSNVRIAAAVAARFKEMHPDDTEGLRALKDQLEVKYPSYTGLPKNLSGAKETINELVRASADPVLAKTEAGRGLAEYVQARQSAMDSARAAGLAGFQTAKSAQPLRDWLAAQAQDIAEQYPDFGVDGGMWDRVLSREVGL